MKYITEIEIETLSAKGLIENYLFIKSYSFIAENNMDLLREFWIN